jgi:hypothetical protein
LEAVPKRLFDGEGSVNDLRDRGAEEQICLNSDNPIWAGKEDDLRKHVPSVPSAAVRGAEQLLLTVGRAGVLSSRSITAGELETLLSLLGPPSERQRSDLQRVTDIVLVEDCTLIYWPRTGEVFAHAAYAMARVQATLA